jgi:hypothetical protein
MKLNIIKMLQSSYKEQEDNSDDEAIQSDTDSVNSIDSETQDTLDMFSQGKKFPQFNEIQGMVNLFEVMIDKYQFIHPQDLNLNKIDKFTENKSVITDFFANELEENSNFVEDDISQSLFEAIQKLFVENVLDINSF